MEVVLEPVTIFARGDRSIGGIIPLIIMTNCDYVDFIYDDEKIGSFYPAKERYPGLSHPPVIIDKMPGEWGLKWRKGEFIGYLNGEEVKRKKYCADPLASKLVGIADEYVLSAGDIDATRIVYKIVDQENNLIPYINETLKVYVDGEGELIGPSEMSLIGGCIAIWVKTKGVKGKIILSASCSRFFANKIIIKVE
jgi:beta-galactosidase